MIERPLENLYPTGTARGWRRTGCLVLLIGGLVLLVLALIVAAVVG
jgi:hypothetical protein